jgi:hypothetical protein
MVFQRITRERKCPVCNSEASYRVRRAGLPVRVVCSVLNLRPHWCPECDTFYLGPRRAKDVRVEETYRTSGKSSNGSNHAQATSLPH